MPHRSRGAPLKLCLVGDFLIERTVNCCKIASISLRTKIFADRDSARTGQGLCDPAPNGQFFRGSPRSRGKRLPRGIAGELLVNAVQFVTRRGLIHGSAVSREKE